MRVTAETLLWQSRKVNGNQPRTRLKETPLKSRADVILRRNTIQEFPNMCHSIHFQSNAISKAKHVPAFILLIRRKNNLHLFISEAMWNERRIKELLRKGHKTERWETAGCKWKDEKLWAHFIKPIHHKCAACRRMYAHTHTHTELDASKENTPQLLKADNLVAFQVELN